jgi:hypothetical protein
MHCSSHFEGPLDVSSFFWISTDRAPGYVQVMYASQDFMGLSFKRNALILRIAQRKIHVLCSAVSIQTENGKR